MDRVNYIKDLFKSLPDYGKIELIMFLYENDVDILHESGFLKNDYNRLCPLFTNKSMEQYEDYLN